MERPRKIIVNKIKSNGKNEVITPTSFLLYLPKANAMIDKRVEIESKTIVEIEDIFRYLLKAISPFVL